MPPSEPRIGDPQAELAERAEDPVASRGPDLDQVGPAAKPLAQGAGLRIDEIRENPYKFISERARNASDKYGVKSVSALAVKPG